MQSSESRSADQAQAHAQEAAVTVGAIANPRPAVSWRMLGESLARPYRVTIPMVLLVALVPFYIFIAEPAPGRPVHVPALPIDRLWPLQPAWALVYGALYLFLIVLPVLLIREEEHIRRTVLAYLTIWITAYACFLFYPTIALRPEEVFGESFGAWGLRFLYGADPPYNCFPSLHVAHSVVSALACWRLHRGVGIGATFAALLVAVSTLFTKQHYVADVAAGILLASIACAVFLWGYRAPQAADRDRRVAPVMAVVLLGAIAVLLGCFWAMYEFTRT